MRASILAVCGCLLGTPMVQAAETGTPETFLTALYGHYPLKDGASPVFDKPQDWLAEPLLGRVRKDRRQAAKDGEAGNLDFDPVCACQDDTGLKGTKVSVDESDGKTARANVRFIIEKTAISVRYRLVATPAGWRIADIATKEVPSLLAMLAKAQR
jgi:hypothetical protein